MFHTFSNLLVKIDDIVWGIPLMLLILAGGILLTWRLRFLQTHKLGLALKWMVKLPRGRAPRRVGPRGPASLGAGADG